MAEFAFEFLGPGGFVSSTRVDLIGLNDIDDLFRLPLHESVLRVGISPVAAFDANLIRAEGWFGLTASLQIGGDENLRGDWISIGMSIGQHAHQDDLSAVGSRMSELTQRMDAHSLELFLENQDDPQFTQDWERLNALRAVVDDFTFAPSDEGQFDPTAYADAVNALARATGSEFASDINALMRDYEGVMARWFEPVYWTITNDFLGGQPGERVEVRQDETWDTIYFNVIDPGLGFAELSVIGTTSVSARDFRFEDFALTYTVTAGVAVTDPVLLNRPLRGATDRADRITGTDLGLFGSLAGGADQFKGSSQSDFVIGGGGNDRLAGRGGDDSLSGGRGNDVLDGGAGNDLLFGNRGADRLISGDVDAVMTGGAGADVFVFRPGPTGFINFRITDFAPDKGDRIDLSAGFGAAHDTVQLFPNQSAPEFVDGPWVSWFDDGLNTTRVHADFDGMNGADLTMVLDGIMSFGRNAVLV